MEGVNFGAGCRDTYPQFLPHPQALARVSGGTTLTRNPSVVIFGPAYIRLTKPRRYLWKFCTEGEVVLEPSASQESKSQRSVHKRYPR